MSELTPNLQLVKPTINGEDTENTWGYDLNANFDILDDAIGSAKFSDGDKGDIIVSAQGELWNFDPTVVTPAGRGVIAVDAQAGLLEQNGATAFRKRGITVANQPPAGGVDGDLWLQYNLALPPEVNWDVTTFYFNTRTEAAASDIPGPIKVVHTGGFGVPGDRGHGIYGRLNGAPPDPTNPGFFRSVDRYKADGGQDPTLGGYWGLVPDGALRLEQFGCKADYFVPGGMPTSVWVVNGSRTDNYNGIMAAIHFGYTHIDTSNSGLPVFSQGYEIELDHGTYYCSQTIIPDRTIKMRGKGGLYHEPLSQIMFPAGVKGFWFRTPATAVAGAGLSQLHDFNIKCEGYGGQTDKHGVHMATTVSLVNFSVENFGGHGVEIFADIGGGTIANLFNLYNVWCSNNAVSGVHCQGGDANAGVGYSVNGQYNGAWGIDDSSFLGNTWTACHTSGNANGGYHGGGANSRSVWVGCYSETDQPPSQFTKSALVLGGLHAAGIDGDAVRITDDFMSGHHLGYTGATTGNRIAVHQATQPNSILGVSIDPTGAEYQSHFVFTPGAGTFGWCHGDPGNPVGPFAFQITSELQIATFGRAEAVPSAHFALPRGVFLGGDDNGRDPRKVWYTDKQLMQYFIGTGHVMMPGAYNIADITFLITDAFGGSDYVGEYCVQAGVVTADVWTSGVTYNNIGKGNTYVKNSAGKFYRAMNSPGTPSTVEPTHASGTVTVGGYQWKWLADQPAIFRRFGNLLGAKSTPVNDPITNLSQTWTAAGVTFQGHRTNITDTASTAASVLEEWQVNGTRKFALGKQGGLGAFGATPPTVQPTVTGSRGGNAALASLITALAATGLIIDGTVA